ncbi:MULTISPECIES: molybdenum cofactor biosynthesis protein MoaE [unclassified Microbacterium]|uniref:molybdenum cofactor biosynthesis protein MoaE n=1 Tax=unclassified Microbacterium TaxID=2609290 RepID=UPI00214B30E7|nr:MULTISPECIES: molybdenum cofactor biosynthesis protein MoaE [unclassified Microbacterium]MCR2809611.1 molybdenum cofactor biosynthesis protein MoaE [Microbacterium sp. zg.B185]WIM18064.1 molybdenum cofactor biosynthesis protein MoaE [Microbacterium sp. zg-B185]
MSDPQRYLALITDQPIDRAAAEAFVMTAADGALVVFEGVVRDHDHGESVHALDYEAHPDAQGFLAAVCAEIAQASGLRVAAVHRVGALTIGDVALVAAVSAPHRADAFAVCAQLVDLVKERTPIWKRQHLAAGTTEWVGL